MNKYSLIGLSIIAAWAIVFASLIPFGSIQTDAFANQSTYINNQPLNKISPSDSAGGSPVITFCKNPSDNGITWVDAQDNYYGANGFYHFDYPNKAIVKNANKYGGITPSNTVFAYVAVYNSDTLTILNATKSWAQTEFNSYPVSGAHDVQIMDYPTYGRVAFLCSYLDGKLWVINVTNPNSMSTLDLKADSSNAGMYIDVDEVNKILYYTDWNSGSNDYLYAYNITNPHDIKLICQAVVPRGKPWSPKVNTNDRDYVYVACEGEGAYANNGSVALFNVTWVRNVTSPSMHYMKTQGWGTYADLKQDGNYLYGDAQYSLTNPPLSWSLHIWDISDSRNLTNVSVTPLQTYNHFCLVKSPSGHDYAFLRHYDTTLGDYGVNIADINDKSNPVKIGYIPDDGGGHTRDLWRCHWMQCAYNNITCNWVLYVVGYMDNSWVTFNITFNYTRPPIANFTYSIKGLSVTFDASSSYDPDGNITSWDWEFGDNSDGVGEIITHDYSVSGSYNVTLTVIDDDGLNDSVSQMITIEKIPEFQAAFMFGRIINLSTQGEFMSFNAVKIRVMAFNPFSFNTYLSGETFTISKDYRGWIGARYILAVCNKLI